MKQANKNKEIIHYNKNGNEKKVERFFRLKFSKNIGFTRQVIVYNDNKKVIRDERYMNGKDQQKFGYKILTYIYNDDGRKIGEEFHFTPNVISQRGFTKFVVDLNSITIKKTRLERFTSAKVEKITGYYRWVTTYNEDELAVSEERFNRQGNLLR